MKPTRPAKLPKGYVVHRALSWTGHHEACLPCRTAKEARAWVRLHGMSREKLIECVAREFMRANWVAFNKQQDGRSVTARDHDNIESSTTVLRALGLISK